MAVTYTTPQLVRRRIEEIDASLLDEDIEQYIYEAEGIIDAVMKDSFKTDFDATKHAIIRSCATNIAAYHCISYNPSVHPSLTDAELIANMLWNAADEAKTILSNPRTVAYLKSL